MAFQKIKNLIKVYKNAYIYNELLNAKETLLSLNIQIEGKYNKINELNHFNSECKKYNILSSLSDKKLFVKVISTENDNQKFKVFR